MSKRKTSRRHSLPQKLVLVVNCLLIAACFAGASVLVFGQDFVSSQKKVPPVINLATAAQASLGPAETFPVADPQAQNFLITGADNNSCVDPNSPFAAAFGDRSSIGERSDTIMVMRVDPATNQAAVLSFPRDLWVKIFGHDGQNRINSAYTKNDPTLLVNTIYQNFGIGIDHFIQVDFCAFKTLVDAVGGVPVPFTLAARDTHTGLYVPQPGCFTFNGDHALAYVRSRHYQTYDEATGKWTEDPLADLGRISRQQDFLRRIVAKALATGVYTPSVARGLIRTAQKYVVTDANLTPQKMLEFAGVIQHVNPTNLHSYQIQVKSETRGGNAVLIPVLDNANMRAILDLFQGKSPLVGAPTENQTPAVDATAVADPNATAPATAAAQPANSQAANSQADGVTQTTAAPTTVAAPADTAPAGPVATDNDQGVVPDRNATC